MSKKLDRRARYTRMMLKRSLLELLKEKPIDKITVKELCEQANINRTTFYTHYRDIAQLALTIREDLFREISKSVENNLNTSILTMMINILDGIKANAQVCRIMFTRFDNSDYLEPLMEFSRQAAIDSWAEINPNVTEQDKEMLFTFYASGCVALIRKWVLGGMQEDVYELAYFITKMCQQGIEAM